MSQAPDYHPAFHSQAPQLGQYDTHQQQQQPASQQMVYAQAMPSPNPINDALLQQWLQWQQVSAVSTAQYPLPPASTQRMEWRQQPVEWRQPPVLDQPLQHPPTQQTPAVPQTVPLQQSVPQVPLQQVQPGPSPESALWVGPSQGAAKKVQDLSVLPDFDYARDTPKVRYD